MAHNSIQQTPLRNFNENETELDKNKFGNAVFFPLVYRCYRGFGKCSMDIPLWVICFKIDSNPNGKAKDQNALHLPKPR